MNRRARRMYSAMSGGKTPMLKANELPNITGYSEEVRKALPLNRNSIKLRQKLERHTKRGYAK